MAADFAHNMIEVQASRRPAEVLEGLRRTRGGAGARLLHPDAPTRVVSKACTQHTPHRERRPSCLSE